MLRFRLSLFVLLALALSSATSVRAQQRFSESFDNVAPASTGQVGPAALTSRGWIFRNQSSPGSNSPAWTTNFFGGFPLGGSGYFTGSSGAAGQFANFSAWAILPPIPGLAAGDVLTLYVLGGGYGATPTHIDIRRSPSGATSTGSGHTAVGDFTEVLFTGELPLNGGTFEYVPVQLTVPGAGRLAIRFHAPFISNFQSVATIYLDELTIGVPPPPPCGIEMPGPGESATWTAAAGPYEICTELTLPAGATLTIEPGTRVNFVHGRDFNIAGSLIVQGSPASPVIFSGDNVTGLSISGDVEMHHAQLACWVALRSGGGASLTDCSLAPEAWLGGSDPDTALSMLRCDVHSQVFSGGGADNYTQVRFLNPAGNVKLGRIARVHSVESVAPVEYVVNGQTRLIENLAITGIAGPAVTVGSDQSGTADVLLDGSNTITASEYPIFIRTAGLHPASVIPTSGNTHNAVQGPFALGSTSDVRSLAALPDVGVPYHMLEDAQFSGRVDIAPGARFQLAEGVGLDHRNDNGFHPHIRGLPGRPIRFERLDPAQPWAVMSSTLGFNIWEHLEIDGPGVGAAATGSYIDLRDCTVSNAAVVGAKPGNRGIIYGSGNRFLNNAIGVECDTSIEAWGSFSGIRFDGAERPNLFEGNTLAAHCPPSPQGPAADDMHMENNWWGDSTGPHEPLFYPAGQGDPIHYPVIYNPWLTAQPALAPGERPVIRLTTRLHPVALPGDKILLEWTASDDRAITRIDIEMMVPPVVEEVVTWQPLATNLPGHTRRAEITVPSRPWGSPKQALFRIHAHDADGHIGLEQFWLLVPDRVPPGTFIVHSDLAQPQVYDDRITLCYTATQPPTGGVGGLPKIYTDLDADMRTLLQRGISPGSNACTDISMPMASTDRARFMVRFEGNNNDDYFYFSDYFSVRPDPRLGDAPPAVQMLTPGHGASFPGGSTIPITWTASDDDFVREFRIQYSANGGYTFHTLADDLPGDLRSFNWRLPASTGVSDLRIRVVAIDKRFQNSADGDDRILAVTPGDPPPPCPADFNADGAATVQDIFDFLTAWFSGAASADVNHTGDITVQDLFDYLTLYFTGC